MRNSTNPWASPTDNGFGNGPQSSGLGPNQFETPFERERREAFENLFAAILVGAAAVGIAGLLAKALRG